jgi:hypothetical protein
MTDAAGLSRANSAAGRLQRALLERLRVHQEEGALPTSTRFLFYELVQAGVVSKAATGKRRPDQPVSEALTHLREVGLVPWDWIEDETRSLTVWRTAPSVAEYVADTVERATLDRWGGPAPLILCESRSLAGALHNLAGRYACPITSTNGQVKGHLMTQVLPALVPGQRVLYLGDWDWCGHQIEAATRRSLAEATFGALHPVDRASAALREEGAEEWFAGQHPWERVALTDEQVAGLGDVVISKADKRYNPVRYFDAVETEAFGQAAIVAAVRARLDELLPEPLEDVLVREEQQRAEVAERLRGLR